ncbi:unnamed protein product [Heterobilharzia americana]|nr:unnamed protein product [Heterobilharzia americana]
MKRGDNNGDPRDWSENSGRRLRPRSPYVYNKAADSFVFDAAHQALEAQYEKSSVSCDSRHCLVKFIRPVSLATLKSLSHTRLNGMKVNVTSSTNSKKIQPILCSRTSHCIDGSTSNSSLANDYSRLSKVSLVGDKRDIRTTDACSRCSFDLVGNEQGFLHSAKSLNSRLLHQKHHLLSDFNSLDETATNIENVIPFQPSVLHRELHTLRKPYVTSSFKIISGSVTSVAIEKTTNNDINSVVPARTNSDLLSVKNAGYLVRHKTEQIFENKQRCLSPYETRPNSRNSIICDSLQKSQSTPTPNLTYKKIKQDFELFKREISRHLKISETVSNNVEKSVYFENKEDGGVFKVVGDGNLNCAIPIYQPYSHSVVILRNHNPRTGEEYRSEENDFDKAKEGSNVDIFGCTECSQIPIQSDNTSAPPQNCIGSGADTGFTQAVYSQKQVEIDSGNGTDEDDHTSKENTLLINASVGQKTTDGISYSNNSDVVEVDECYLSDDGQIEDDEESQGDSDKSSDNGHQSNEEVSASPTNSSYSETLGNNSSDIECSTDLPTINKLLEVRCDSEKYHSDETDLDANDKPEIIEVYVDEDSNTDLCISSKLSNLKLSTFSTITEKHSKLSVTSYDPSTTKKDILSAGRSIPSIEQKVISKDDRASISSQSSKLSNNHNIPTENSIKDEKTLNW